MKKLSVYALCAFVIIAASIPVIIPFFRSGFFPTHDGEWAVVRLGEMFRELKDFQIPARFSGSLNFGYGYPLFNFTYPFPYYIGVVFHFLGIGFVDTIKLLFAVSVPLSAFFMFLAAKELWRNNLAGLLGALLYIYFPYRFVDLYVRGSLGESLAFVLFPLFFFFALKSFGAPWFNLFLIFAAFAYGLLISTHNIMAVLFSVFIGIFFLCLFIITKKKVSLVPFIAIVLGFLLSSFFWIPAIFEKQYLSLSQIPIADRSLYFVSPLQLIASPWGYGTPTDNNAFTYQLGIAHSTVFLVVFGVIIFSMIKRKKIFKDTYATYASIFLLIIAFFFFLLFSPSLPVWQYTPLLSEINYPWTVLSQLAFLTSLLAGFLIRKGKIFTVILTFLVLVSVALYLPNAKPASYVDRGDAFYLTNEATTTSSDELMPLWVKEKPNQRFKEKVEVIEGKAVVKDVSYNSKKITFNLDSLVETKIRINTIYYPGWKAQAKSKELSINYSNDQGIMELQLPKGSQSVILSFSETPLRLFADFLSIFSFIALVIFSIKFKHGVDKKTN